MEDTLVIETAKAWKYVMLQQLINLNKAYKGQILSKYNITK